MSQSPQRLLDQHLSQLAKVTITKRNHQVSGPDNRFQPFKNILAPIGLSTLFDLGAAASRGELLVPFRKFERAFWLKGIPD